MIKRICGEECGLELTTKEKSIYLCPSKKKSILINARNSTEYDMQLFVSFTGTFSGKLEKKELDFFVPAQGLSTLTINIHVSDDEKMYMGNGFLEFSVTNRVLGWKNEYELPLFCENVFICGKKNDFSPQSHMLFSSNGIIYLNENECALLEIACTDDEDVIVFPIEGEILGTYLDTNPCQGKNVSLKKGLNRLCIQSKTDCCVKITSRSLDVPLCLNTINPKYFL